MAGVLPNIVNAVAFQLSWIACVAGAGRGYTWLGPAVVGGALLAHLSMAAEPARQLRLILLVGAAGALLDSTFGLAGLYSFRASPWPAWLAPPWIIALWMVFATTLGRSLAWLRDRPGLAAGLGAVAGPLSYWSGLQLGAVEIGDLPLTMTVLTLAWGALLPVLYRVSDSRAAGVR